MFLCRKLALYVQEMNGRGAGELSGNGGFGCFLVFSFFFFFKSGKDVFKSLLGFTNWCGVKKMSCPSADSLSLKIQGYVVLCPSWASNTDSEKKFEKKKKARLHDLKNTSRTLTVSALCIYDLLNICLLSGA